MVLTLKLVYWANDNNYDWTRVTAILLDIIIFAKYSSMFLSSVHFVRLTFSYRDGYRGEKLSEGQGLSLVICRALSSEPDYEQLIQPDKVMSTPKG